MFDGIIQNIFNALQWGSFYSLIALGYCLVYGVLLLINFAHGDVFMVGAYLAFFLATFFLGAGSLPHWLILVLIVPLTMILTSLVGVTLERVAYRPLRRKGANKLYVVITALMCGLILEHTNLAILGAGRRSFPTLVDQATINLAGLSVTHLKIAVIIVAILVFILLELVISKTKIGMAMRAISYDRFAIPLMGIPPENIIVFTFVLGSGLAGLAGLLFAMSYPVLDPYMGAMIGWKAFIAAVVGGIGEIRGALVGGFLLGFVEIMAVAFFPSTFRDLIAFTILLLILWKKPTGLFGVSRYQKI
ncbi:MAG: branched-chain amino acid ABC transporter permease [Deltaproteobacteria bacterium]|nr:branched-chain amino acid ABC transporter permease [Deltaproteobacteria bacterium]